MLYIAFTLCISLAWVRKNTICNMPIFFSSGYERTADNSTEGLPIMSSFASQHHLLRRFFFGPAHRMPAAAPPHRQPDSSPSPPWSMDTVSVKNSSPPVRSSR